MDRSYPIVRKSMEVEPDGAIDVIEMTDEEFERLGKPERVLIIIEAADGPLSAKGDRRRGGSLRR